MRLVVQDASVLIDLGTAEMLDAWFDLEIETLTTSLVWREVNRRSQKARLKHYAKDERIKIVPVGTEALSEVVKLKLDLPPSLTLNDASVLHLAMTNNATLLTGDQNLRKCAESRNIPVHGLLWLLDYLVTQRAITAPVAVRKLEMLCRLNPRLPKVDCEEMLKKWREA